MVFQTKGDETDELMMDKLNFKNELKFILFLRTTLLFFLSCIFFLLIEISDKNAKLYNLR